MGKSVGDEILRQLYVVWGVHAKDTEGFDARDILIVSGIVKCAEQAGGVLRVT